MATVLNRRHRRHSNPSAENMLTALKQEGYGEGFPPWVTEQSRGIDRQLCSVLRCQTCGHKGLCPRPVHRPTANGKRPPRPQPSYQLVGHCPACGAGELC